MATNDFLPFANGAGANVLTQPAYLALTTLRGGGFSSGTAQSAQLNKVWRQASLMSSVLAQLIVDTTGQDAIDDGTTATLLANLKASIKAQPSGIVGQCRNLKMSMATVSATATLTADEIVVESALGGLRYCLPSFNKTINLATAGAGGMDTGAAPASGFVGLYAIYNPLTGASALLAANATAAILPNVYGGASMPAGYTASALISVWATNASGQFAIGMQVDREISIATNTVFTTTTTQASLTSFSIAAVVPRNAVTCRCDTTVGSSAAGAGANAVICGTPFEVGRVAQGATSPTAGATTISSFPHIPILNAQTLYYRGSVSGGTFNFVVSISAYTI